MSLSSWIENHPFKMAGIISLFITFFAILYHAILIKPHDWVQFIIWLPAYLSIPYGLAFLCWTFEKLKGGNTNNGK